MPAEMLVRPGIMGMNWNSTKHGHAVNGLDTESLAEDDEAGDEEQDVYRELGVGDGDAVDAVVDYRSQAGDAASGDLVGVEECCPAEDEDGQSEGHDCVFFQVFQKHIVGF